jgi:Zn-dependent peptidase ImmA (M78 family)/DNA-binding XRE family transcriptional regulator
MRAGTPGFVGARLRAARDARQLSAVTLAELVGVTPQSISNYELEISTPGPGVLQAIAGAVNLPEQFFSEPVRDIETPIFFRSMASTTKRARAKARVRLEWLQAITDHLAQFVQLPAPHLPDFEPPTDPNLLSFAEIEELAVETRRFWSMRDDPVGNMVYLLENQGVIVARDNLGAESLDGLSNWTPERPFVMIGTDKGTAVRWRFDAAHELGHLVLHNRIDPALLSKTADFKLLEAQAHRFAGAFLLPLQAFADDFFAANLDALRGLKAKWRVSIGAIIMRARDTEMISESTARHLLINYGRRGWRKAEPLDDELEAEFPRLLARSFEVVLAEPTHTPADTLLALGLTSTDVENLAGLAGGYLTSDFAPVSLLNRPSPGVGVEMGAQARVLQFRPKP